ncbi:MAG: class I SAM-dependent methyltransferase [Chloroflexota bacterium]
MNPDQYYAHHLQDILNNDGGLPEETYQKVRRYYKNLRTKPELHPFYRYNWTRRVVPMVDAIATLPINGGQYRILDAGCGVGTETLMWGIQRDDLSVVGVDVHSDRLNAAQGRVGSWSERMGRPLDISFAQADIFKILASERFDLIWTMEAISHIDPAEKFLEDAFKSLNRGGRLVISDSHFLNPKMLWRIFKLRLNDRRVTTKKTLETGETITYAHERLFSVPGLDRLLKGVGFKTVEAQLSIFFLRNMLKSPSWQSADQYLNQMPLVRQLGGIYTVVATK